MIGLHLIGFAAFAIVGWLMLDLLRQLYESKRISEQSINVDAMWLLFGIVNSIGLVFEGYRWFASGFVAFAIYKIIAAGCFVFAACRGGRTKKGHRLLLLRVFALGKRSEQLYDTLGKSWRTVGSIQMIAGPDLATTTIEPHEFLDFVSGKLDRRFIDTGRTLDLRIDQMDLAPDREGQFRVTEFFCHDDTWKMTLARLADDSDAVLMDLRGFSPGQCRLRFRDPRDFQRRAAGAGGLRHRREHRSNVHARNHGTGLAPSERPLAQSPPRNGTGQTGPAR